MPSRSARSRSRSPSRRHKKKHKRSRKSSDGGSPPSSKTTTTTIVKKDDLSNGKESTTETKPLLPSVTLPPSILAKIEPKDEEKATTPPPAESSPGEATLTTAPTTKKRKRRWIGDETEKVFLPNMPTTISAATMTEQQQKIYLLQVQVEELTRRLKVNDLGIPVNPHDRSPSPEPIYDQQGKRQNTREVRSRRKIEDQRHQLITDLLAINPDYKAPGDYKPQTFKHSEKVTIPQDDYPEVNFVGLIIGPRGSTLKNLEKDTGAKIIIRGKGSVKDGKMGLVKHGPMPGEDEPLHAFITGMTQEMVTKAAEKVQEIIHQSVDAPEGLNELRKQQLRQLALLNGTLRENDSLIKLKLMGEAEKIVTNTIICTVCGGAGHVPSDCKFRRNPDGTFVDPNVDGSFLINVNPQEQQKLDCEYQSLINELSGKKDSDNSNLSLADRRNLMSGSKTAGPTLAITGGPGAMDTKGAVTTIGSTSFNSNGSMNTHHDYNPPSLMSLSANQSNSSSQYSNSSSSYSSTSFSGSGPRYNNNDVFDGYHLLRRNNRNNNYSSYIEGDSYRAQHIPALLENGGNSNSSSWSNSSSYYQQNNSNQQWNQWNPYNTNMYYQNTYQQPQQQQHYQNNNSGFVPPLPKAPPPPPPPSY